MHGVYPMNRGGEAVVSHDAPRQGEPPRAGPTVVSPPKHGVAGTIDAPTSNGGTGMTRQVKQWKKDGAGDGVYVTLFPSPEVPGAWTDAVTPRRVYDDAQICTPTDGRATFFRSPRVATPMDPPSSKGPAPRTVYTGWCGEVATPLDAPSSKGTRALYTCRPSHFPLLHTVGEYPEGPTGPLVSCQCGARLYRRVDGVALWA